MKKKLKKFIKKCMLRVERFEALSKVLKRYLKKINKARLEKEIRTIHKKYGEITADECNIKEIDITHIGEKASFGFDALGMVDDIKDIDLVEYCSSLSDVLENNEIDVRIAVASEQVKREKAEMVLYFEEIMKLYVLAPGEGIFVKCGDVKVLFFATELRAEKNKYGYTDVVKKIAFANNNGALYVVGYVVKDDKSKNNRIRMMKALADLGCNYVLCGDKEQLRKGKDYRRLTGEHTNFVRSIGSLFGVTNPIKKFESNGAVAIRVKFMETNELSNYAINQGFIPMYNVKKDGVYKEMVRIDYHNTEHRKNEDIMDSLLYIENQFKGMRDIRNILTIKEICDILGVELPSKYSKLGNLSVGKVCARSLEVTSGDVFFFLEPFNDNNDKEVLTLADRIHLVHRSIRKGARFVFSYEDLDEKIPHIKIDNCREAHIKVCSKLRSMYEVKTIGVTGSVGKTSTKDMLYEVLSQKYKTYKNYRNSNVQVNIGMHIQNFSGTYEMYIQEIGGGRPGGASRHSRMILPEACIVTNIGQAHIGNYGSQENLMYNKLGITEGMKENGTLYLNGDDELLKTAVVPCDVVYYAVNNHDADYYADSIVEDDGKTYFDIVHDGQRVNACLNVLGEYNVLNAVCSYAIGKKYELSDEEIVNGIANFKTSGLRQNLLHIGGYNLFVDCFNASPHSIDMSLSVLEKLNNNRKIAVIGDVTGMAEMSKEIHVSIGEIVTKHKMDILVCYGEESEIVYNIAKESGINAFWFTKASDLIKFLKNNMQYDDVILFKGSSKTLLSERIDELFGTDLSDQRYIDEARVARKKYNRMKYNSYPKYATLIKNNNPLSLLEVGPRLMHKPVYSIAKHAFEKSKNLEKIIVRKGIRHIGLGCFKDCFILKKVVTPKSLKYIGDYAFSNCGELREIKLKEGLLHIGEMAFKNCTSLAEIKIPDSVQYIGDGVFDGCSDIIVRCSKGSFAEKYCEKNSIYCEVH